MYCIAVYDIGIKRISKVLKLFRQYLNWIQNSTFEGDLSLSSINELRDKIESIINYDEDSVVIFVLSSSKYIDKQIIGKDKSKHSTNLID